uniref:50S ribosomal protein L19 n=1 Tax=Caulerpa lentillifera TaxID=148947 RepID=A0A345HGY1_9CHLO|nr:50S ribosomal protein L19 [Caulerpa lentillifera]AXG75871.1 50S ribosomal protein L19 [Caulerpa lentillifera]QKS32312.1 50S ribosomal protein L19 [Caulerpa lentillifera]QUV75693.1 ribosomal protein L19 [Caulerpa lentillifera]
MKSFDLYLQKKTGKTWKFSVGDYIKVGLTTIESTQKKRVQFSQGIVIAIKGVSFHSNQKMVTLRRPGSFGIERVFASNSPQIQNLQILQSQKFRRSKLFYLRKSTPPGSLRV